MGSVMGRAAAAAMALVLTVGCVANGGGGARPGATRSDRAAQGGAAHHGPASTPPPAPLRAGERFVRLAMPRPFTPVPPKDSTDEYRCFLIDPGFTKRTFLTGSQFLPRNAGIVHHAIFFRVLPSDVADARRLDAETPGDGWTCFGGTGIGGDGAAGRLRGAAAWIAAWAPGGREAVLRDHTGYEMPRGSQIVMQIHYNLLATGGKPAGTDQSGIRLRVMGGSADLDPLQTTLVPAPVELPCAPGEAGPLCNRTSAVLDVWHRFGEAAGATVSGLNLLCNAGQAPRAGPTQHCDREVRQAGVVRAVAGHMHLLGRSIKVELNPGTSHAKTLLDVPQYNFDDQNARPLAKPVKVGPGDTLRVTCTHDATLRRQLPEMRSLPPRYVVWGDGTSDEMCLGIVIWSNPA
ncbi:MAG TPA: monooxygenase [Streptosporangiaceae bacterium]|nr:monooxygenase [Streptosporangiaceae bacterium]